MEAVSTPVGMICLPNMLIGLTDKRKTAFTSARPSIPCITSFAYTYVGTDGITTHCIDVTAVRVGRTLVDI